MSFDKTKRDNFIKKVIVNIKKIISVGKERRK